MDLANIAAVIVAYNSQDELGDCVDAIFRSGIRRVVIQDNSEDAAATLAVVDSLSGLPLSISVHATGYNAGFGGAVNLAVASLPDYLDILLVNPDCLIDARVVTELVKAANADSRIGILAPAMRDMEGKRTISAGGRPTVLKEWLAKTPIPDMLPRGAVQIAARCLKRVPYLRHLAAYAKSSEDCETSSYEWVSGFCMLIRRDCWSDVSGFNEALFMYFEDVGLCRDAQRLGWKVLHVGDVDARHAGSTSAARVGKSRLYDRGMVSYFNEYGSPLQRWLVRRLGWAS